MFCVHLSFGRMQGCNGKIGGHGAWYIDRSVMQDPLAVSNFLALSKKSFAIKFDLENTEYDAIENIGTGAYGVVCSAIHRKTGEKVAIKKIPKIFEQIIVAMRTYREIRILKHFKHNNVISIREILLPKEDLPTFQDIYIVLDLMESDLHRIIYSQQELTNDHIRWFLYQILRGLKYIHSANVVHRDLKPSNLLVNGNCDLKIGDFGMSRGIYSVPDDSNIKMTQYVATRWYRAPEIILQSPTYTTGVDVWSVGCILAEMIVRKPLFPGKDYRNQLEMVFDVVGTPSAAYVDTAHSELIKEFLVKFPKKTAADFAELFPGATPKAIRLLRRFLSLDPKERLTVNEALQDPYLSMYHEPDDEPICTPPFDFSFEKQFKDLFDKKDLQSKILRDIISREILDYHTPTWDDDAAGKNLKPESSTDRQDIDESSQNQWQSLKEQLEFLDSKPENSGPSAAVPELSQTIDLVNNHDVALGSTDGATSRSLLTIEITPAANDNCLSSVDCVDVEMKSAKGDGGKLTVNQQQQDQLDSDVRMLSAKLEEKCNITSVEEESSVVPSNDKVIPSESSSQLDAKAKIKAALLNTELRQQRIELSQKLKVPSKPRAAIQMQKKREEKRRLKQEKALERKKKKNRDASSPKGPVLSDEDRTLLERWQSMQKSSHNQQQQSNYTTSSSSCTTNAFRNTQSNIPASTYADLLTNSGPLVHPGMNGLMSVTDASVPSQPITFNLSNTSSAPSLLSCIPSSVDPPANRTGALMVPPAEFSNQFMPVLMPTGQSSSLRPVPEYSLMPGSYSGGLSHLNAPGDPLMWAPAAVKGPSNGTIQTMNIHNCPPSYSEALAAKHFDSERYRSDSLNRRMLPLTVAEGCATTSFQSSNNSLKYMLDRQESQGFTLNDSESVGIPSILPELLVCPPSSKANGQIQNLAHLSQSDNCGNKIPAPTAHEAICPSLSGYLRGGGGDGSLSSIFQETMVDPLHIVTNRLTKSHLEDLTVQTPRGTGFGYGVGMDLSSFIASTSASDNRGVNEGPESAPLSAQLMADWRFVTGDMDANDFEVALQLDFPEIESCLNLSDFNALT